MKVLACGVCRTDLHVVDGELPNATIPIVPGHEIVGRVEAVGHDVTTLVPGTRIGIPWLGWSCGVCDYCRANRENLCPNARYTGYQLNGGYAEFAVADASFCFPLPAKYDDVKPRRSARKVHAGRAAAMTRHDDSDVTSRHARPQPEY